MPRIDDLRVRSGTHDDWTLNNPVLDLREISYNSTLRKFKVGDGVTPYNDLPFTADGGATPVVSSLTSTDAASALAADQGPIITNQVAVALNAATNATNTAAAAAATATSASSTAAQANTIAASANQAATAAVTAAAGKASKTGDTFTGNITVPTPTASGHAATKAYVDSAVASVAPATAISTTFNQAIPFDAVRYMPLQVVSGALTFTVNSSGAVVGGECTVSLQANGVNTPNFSAFTLVGTQAYDNTAGRINEILFFKTSTGYYYGVILGSTVDITAPTLTSAVVQAASPSVVVATFSENLSGTLPAASAFTVSGHTVSSIAAGATANIVNITVSSPFVNGEAARTLAYTKPGTNNLKDAANNEVANFSGASITNNVTDTTAPTVTAAAVANATPTKVRVTFSEAISSTLPAFSAFTVSGHTVSGITYVDSTNIDLTVDTFVYGETRTLAYTQPGTNNLKDLAGNNLANFSGFSITDNVAAAGILSYSTFTPGSTLDAQAVGTTDWINVRLYGPDYLRKSGGSMTCHKVGAGTTNPGGMGITVSVPAGTERVTFGTDATGSTMGPDSSDEGITFNSDSGGTGFNVIVPVGTVEQIIDIYVLHGNAVFNSGTYHLSAVLADGSATLSPFTVSPSGWDTLIGHRFHVKGSGSTTFTFTVTGSTTEDAAFVRGPTVVMYPA